MQVLYSTQMFTQNTNQGTHTHTQANPIISLYFSLINSLIRSQKANVYMSNQYQQATEIRPKPNLKVCSQVIIENYKTQKHMLHYQSSRNCTSDKLILQCSTSCTHEGIVLFDVWNYVKKMKPKGMNMYKVFPGRYKHVHHLCSWKRYDV